jgi:AcrR family transcriptional regulator
VSDGPSTRPVGLRERKKARTRDAIQRHALRLFREQGYDATTIEQIAEAAEVSPSTFFRYFPTKEDLVLSDEYDPMILAAFHGQPAGVPPVRALRDAIRSVSAGFGAEERAAIEERWRLSLEVPQVRAAALLNLTAGIDMVAEALAKRAGRDAPGFADRTLSGALMGVWMSALFHWGEHHDEDMFEAIDRAMELMEGAGLTG